MDDVKDVLLAILFFGGIVVAFYLRDRVREKADEARRRRQG